MRAGLSKRCEEIGTRSLPSAAVPARIKACRVVDDTGGFRKEVQLAALQ